MLYWTVISFHGIHSLTAQCILDFSYICGSDCSHYFGTIFFLAKWIYGNEENSIFFVHQKIKVSIEIKYIQKILLHWINRSVEKNQFFIITSIDFLITTNKLIPGIKPILGIQLDWESLLYTLSHIFTFKSLTRIFNCFEYSLNLRRYYIIYFDLKGIY